MSPMLCGNSSPVEVKRFVSVSRSFLNIPGGEDAEEWRIDGGLNTPYLTKLAKRCRNSTPWQTTSWQQPQCIGRRFFAQSKMSLPWLTLTIMQEVKYDHKEIKPFRLKHQAYEWDTIGAIIVDERKEKIAIELITLKAT